MDMELNHQRMLEMVASRIQYYTLQKVADQSYTWLKVLPFAKSGAKGRMRDQYLEASNWTG